MSKRLDNSTKAKILFVLLSVVLILITWYKLKVQGITMTEDPQEPTYQALLICNNTDENHVHTDECYEQVEVEANEVQEQEIPQDIVETVPEDIVELVPEEENTIATTVNSIENEVISEENSVNEIIPGEETIEEFTKELKYEDDELVVIATAEDEKTIPNKASISVCKINKDDEKYAKVEKSLKEKGEEENTTIEGFIAYDITLRDEAFNEIEPNGKVNISLNYKNALIPEGIENQDLDINVHHFEEDEQGNVVEIVNLSENNQLQKIETDDQQKLEKVEFETESFSMFTITWTRNSTRRATITVDYVDEDGNVLDVSETINDETYTGTNKTYTFSDYKKTIEGYDYSKAILETNSGNKDVTSVRFSTTSYWTTTTNTVTFYNGNSSVASSTNSGLNYNVHLVYEKQKPKSIRFVHRTQDDDDFYSKGDSYVPPYTDYGYSSRTDPTNIVQFVVVLADSNGKLHLLSDESGPSVELPEGSVVPNEYSFELGADGVFEINENTFSGISVPGYSYSGAYAYFGWYSNKDINDMAVVQTFKNLGKVSTRYPNYYSQIGFTTSRGNPGYNDYSQADFGTAGNGYYAYNPTGVLMLVLQPVNDTVTYKTNFHNDYNPGGSARINVVDTTSARMIRDDWNASLYQYNWHGEAIMTSLDVNSLTKPGDEYSFAGWYDSVDSEGNGTGNKIVGVEQTENGTTYYFAMKDGQKIILNANNDIYARWVPRTTSATVKKIDREGTLLQNVEFTLTDNTTQNQTVKITDVNGLITFDDLMFGRTYTLTESGAPETHYGLEKAIQISISEDGEITITNQTELDSLVTINDSGEIEVINIKHMVLPKAGGIGIYANYAIGIGIMLVVLTIWNCKIFIKRKE